MSSRCRDCPVCTRPLIVRLVMLPFKMLLFLVFGWNIWILVRATKRYCPQCGHWLSQHQRRADGSFKD